MLIRSIRFALACSCLSWCAESSKLCQATPDIKAELQKAALVSSSVTDPFGALEKAAPFLAVRDRQPDDLFAHEAYQDAIHENGIEGHLRLLAKQYGALDAKHPGDPMYHYLSLRTMVGRGTPEAIRGLNELLLNTPDFAPAHRTLAEIYGTDAFRDPEKELSEKEKFLALCPGCTFTRRPASVPDPSPLIEQASRLLGEDGDPDRIIAMTIQGLKEFEWRSQRIRAFDWYSRDYKLRDARELRAKYWQAWPIQVRCHRKAGRLESANALLATMEQRAAALHNQSGPAYWEALDTLAQLYAEGEQIQQATQKLDELQRFLSENPDQAQTMRLDRLRKSIGGPGR
jgi:hypothetical protein